MQDFYLKPNRKYPTITRQNPISLCNLCKANHNSNCSLIVIPTQSTGNETADHTLDGMRSKTIGLSRVPIYHCKQLKHLSVAALVIVLSYNFIIRPTILQSPIHEEHHQSLMLRAWLLHHENNTGSV